MAKTLGLSTKRSIFASSERSENTTMSTDTNMFLRIALGIDSLEARMKALETRIMSSNGDKEDTVEKDHIWYIKTMEELGNSLADASVNAQRAFINTISSNPSESILCAAYELWVILDPIFASDPELIATAQSILKDRGSK